MSALTVANELIERAKAENRKFLMEHEAKAICREYGLPVAVSEVAKTPEEAVEIANKIGYPVVMKIVSPQVIHKSDVGGVIVGVKTPEEVKRAYDEIVNNVKKHVPNAEIIGILVQEMAPHSTEVIVGAIRDAQFGPVIMFGLGGVLVELIKDVSFRVAPVDKDEALLMMKEIKTYKLLEGYRGAPKADLDALSDIIVKTSKLMMDLKDVAQLDLNPVFAYEKGAKIVDARIILS